MSHCHILPTVTGTTTGKETTTVSPGTPEVTATSTTRQTSGTTTTGAGTTTIGAGTTTTAVTEGTTTGAPVCDDGQPTTTLDQNNMSGLVASVISSKPNSVPNLDKLLTEQGVYRYLMLQLVSL